MSIINRLVNVAQIIKMMSTVLHNVSVLKFQKLLEAAGLYIKRGSVCACLLVCSYANLFCFLNKIYCLLMVVLCHFS